MVASASFAQAAFQLPASFKKCVAQSESSDQQAYYVNCSQPDDSIDEYGNVFVQFLPGTLDVDAIDQAKRRDFLRRIEAFFAPATNSAVISAEFRLKRENDDEGTLLDTFPLMSFTKDDRKGLLLDQDIATLSNRIGYRFRISGDARVFVKITAIYTKNRNFQIVERLGQISKLLKPLGWVPMSAEKKLDAISQAKAIDTALRQEFRQRHELTTFMPLGYEEGAFLAGYRSVNLRSPLLPVGNFFVGLERRPSVLVDNARRKDDGTWDFNTPDFSVDTTERILDRRIAGSSLIAKIRNYMTPSDLADLAGEDVTRFGGACQLARDTLRRDDMALNPKDRTLAFWALTASNLNTGNRAIRKQSCFKIMESGNSFKSNNLPLRPLPPLPLTPSYLQLLTNARHAADQADQIARSAQAVSDGAIAASVAARRTPPAPNHAIVPWPGLYQYAGSLPASNRPGRGQIHYLDPNVQGDLFSGDVIMNGTLLTPAGPGRYVTASPSGAQPRTILGVMANGRFDGEGRLEWSGGEVYRGAIANGMPQGLGYLEKPDGTVAIAPFTNGKADGAGFRKDGTADIEQGTWLAGTFTPLESE